MAAKRPPAASSRSRSREQNRRELRSSPHRPRQPDSGAGLRRRRGALGTVLVLLLALVGWGARQFYLRQRPGETTAAESMEPAERALREGARLHLQDPAAPRNLGLYLLEHQRPYAALWAFQDTLDRCPGDAEARLGLARALTMAQLPRRALSFLGNSSDATVPSGSTGSLEERRVAADAYRAMGDPIGTVGVLRSAGPALERSALDLLTLGLADEALGDDSAAEAAYQRCLQLAPPQERSSIEAELALGRLAARGRRWREASGLLGQARQAAPDDPRPLYQLGRALQARGGPDADSSSPGGAIRLFEQALASHPDFGPAQLQIGRWHLRHRRPEPAAAYLARAAATGAGGADTLLRLAEALEASGQPAAACYKRGACFMLTQQPRRAIPEYQRMDRLDPGRPDALLLLITAHAKLDEMGEAAAVAGRALLRFPDNSQLLARRAMLLLTTDDQAAGARLCRRWLERQPDAAEPYRLLGSLEREGRRYAEAVRLCDQAMARDPRNAEYCREMASALVGTPTPANLRRAATGLRQAIVLNDRDAEAPLQLGDVLQRLGDLDGARDQYLRSMDRNPTDRRPVVALSQLCVRLGKGDRMTFYSQIVRVLHEREESAQRLWRQVFRSPGDVDAHARLAQLLLEAADLRQARYQLEQAIALRPDRQPEARQLPVVTRILTLQEQ